MQRNTKQSKPGESLEAKSHTSHLTPPASVKKKIRCSSRHGAHTKVRTRWCRAEELGSPEEGREEKEEMGMAFRKPLTSLYILTASKLL